MELFDQEEDTGERVLPPLAERIRPRILEDFVGQEHLVGKGRVLYDAIQKDRIFSMIFWGDPGVGKTTLARIIAAQSKSDIYSLSAVSSGVKELREIIRKAGINRKSRGRRTILFIDEVHHFNKSQQDALLSSVEDGTVIFIGSTTENPSFEIIPPLLSRCRVLRFEPLGEENLLRILDNALKRDVVLTKKRISFARGVKGVLIRLSGEDARVLLNILELAVDMAATSPDGVLQIDREILENAALRRTEVYDKKGDYHYDTISAFIKSLRGSDPDGAIYWLARMLEAGEDPKFIARRMIILASEDIGNADPQALILATSCFQAVERVGMPEARIVLSQTAAYLASCPKSNAAYVAICEASEDVRKAPPEPVPLHLRNPVTGLMRGMGYGRGYKYAHDYEEGFAHQENLPPKLKDRIYYRPKDIGEEKKIKERLEKFWKKRRK